MNPANRLELALHRYNSQSILKSVASIAGCGGSEGGFPDGTHLLMDDHPPPFVINLVQAKSKASSSAVMLLANNSTYSLYSASWSKAMSEVKRIRGSLGMLFMRHWMCP